MNRKKTILLLLIIVLFFIKPITIFASPDKDLDVEINKFIRKNITLTQTKNKGYAFLLARKIDNEKEVFASEGNADCFIINDPRGYLHNYPQPDYPEATAKVNEILKILPALERYFEIVKKFEHAKTGYVNFYLISSGKLKLYSISEKSLEKSSNPFFPIYAKVKEIKDLFMSTLD
jgi:hypothetical protein